MKNCLYRRHINVQLWDALKGTISHTTRTFIAARRQRPSKTKIENQDQDRRLYRNQLDDQPKTLTPTRRLKMKKLITSTLTAAVVLSAMSASFAAPKHPVQGPKQTVQEPIYFTLATGQE